MNHDLFALMQSMDDTPIERESEIIRGPFPYPGSKFRSIKEILPEIPDSKTWVEAFGGTGIITLNKRRSKLEVFNERHAGIVAFYRCLQNPTKQRQLIDRLELTVHSREDYIWSQETWEHDVMDDVERAARWYYTLVYSFAGVGRNFGRAIRAETRFAGKLRDYLPLFQPIHDRFQFVQIENLDWRLMLKDYDSDDTVFYLDPPYLGKNIYRHNMSRADHIELCQRIFQCRGYVILSGYDNEIYNNFPWDRTKQWSVHVSVTTKALETDTSNVVDAGSDNNIERLWIKDFG